MHAVIFLGGAAFRLPDALRDELCAAELIIAADRGWDNAALNGLTPGLLVGDMDSISDVPSGVETFRVPSVKDDADGQLAVNEAIARGATRVTLVGQLSGRADHTLSALYMLDALRLRSVEAEMVDDRNRVRVICGETVILRRRGYRYFGVISLGETIYSAHGCFYEADRAALSRTNPTLGISNEITAETAEIEVSGDPAFLVESC